MRKSIYQPRGILGDMEEVYEDDKMLLVFLEKGNKKAS